MASFVFTFIDSHGKKKSQKTEANSQKELEHRLNEEGLLVVDIRQGDKAVALNAPTKFRTKVKRRDLIEFCIFMGMMSESGVALTTALQDFSNESKLPEWKAVIEDLNRQILAGESLSSAMGKHENVFHEEFIQLIHAGERTGTLDSSFRELQNYLEWQEKMSSDIRQATLYPKVVTSVLGVFLLYLFSGVVPGIAKILVKMDIPLPTITRIVLAISDFAVQTWWLWLFVFVGFPFVFRTVLKRYENLAYKWDDFKLKLPLLGNLTNLITQARFIQNFGIIHRAGIPIVENLELCSKFVGNKVFTRAIERIRNNVREGVGLTESMRTTGLFSGLVLRMINLGESTGKLDNSLEHASEYYNRELPRRIKKIFSILEPALILSLVAIVGVVALSIFLPILSISGSVR